LAEKLCEHAWHSVSRQASEKQANAVKIDERLTADGKSLVVFAQPP
jgi:hypothetical protein